MTSPILGLWRVLLKREHFNKKDKKVSGGGVHIA